MRATVMALAEVAEGSRVRRAGDCDAGMAATPLRIGRATSQTFSRPIISKFQSQHVARNRSS
jgi:hypothetical protein